MSLRTKYAIYRKFAIATSLVFIFQSLIPLEIWALTGGPSSPEFSSFEPVATTNLVNEFSGDFTYNIPVLNIPGANGGGYALGLSYHSGASPEEEASWVGYGWTLNPGAINRHKRGFPDDWKNSQVTYWNKSPASVTVAAGGGIGGEIFSIDLPVNASASLRYNNYKGFGYTVGVGISDPYHVMSLGYNMSDGEGSFSLRINPAGLLNAAKESGKTTDQDIDNYNKLTDKDKARKKGLNRGLNKLKGISSSVFNTSTYGALGYTNIERPTQITEYSGQTFTASLGVLVTPGPIPAGISANLNGSLTRQTNKEEDVLSTFGYMYSSEAQSSDMMDYYVEKASTYNKRDKFLGIPFSSADNFSISGEGLSGGFRMYNKKAGHFFPNRKTSTTNMFTLGFEVEVGLDIGIGADVDAGHQTLNVHEWNSKTQFASENSDSDEPNFFRFTGDLGGSVEFGSSNPQKANINGSGSFPGTKSFDPDVSHIEEMLNQGKRSGRSSHISYNLNSGIESFIDNKRYRAYTKDEAVHNHLNRAEAKLQDQIGEFSTVALKTI